jgi:cell division protein FtsQ
MEEQKTNIFLRRKRLFLVIIISGFLFLGFIADRWRQDLTLTSVRVEGNNLLSVENVIKSSDIKLSSGLYDYDLKDIEERVCRNPYVENAVVSRNLPSTIDIRVMEREPIASIITDKIYYIDREKKIFSYNFVKEIVDLPVISGMEFEINPKTLASDPEIDSLLFLLGYLKRNYKDIYNIISEINLGKTGFYIVYISYYNIPIIMRNRNCVENILNFRAYWNQYSMYENKNSIEYIDLRYTDQVVVKKKI